MVRPWPLTDLNLGGHANIKSLGVVGQGRFLPPAVVAKLSVTLAMKPPNEATRLWRLVWDNRDICCAKDGPRGVGVPRAGTPRTLDTEGGAGHNPDQPPPPPSLTHPPPLARSSRVVLSTWAAVWSMRAPDRAVSFSTMASSTAAESAIGAPQGAVYGGEGRRGDNGLGIGD